MKSLRDQLSELIPLIENIEAKNPPGKVVVTEVVAAHVGGDHAAKYTICPQCNCKIRKNRLEKHLESHRAKKMVPANEFENNSGKKKEKALVFCPVCNARLSKIKLFKHLSKVHSVDDKTLYNFSVEESYNAHVKRVPDEETQKQQIRRRNSKGNTRIWQPKPKAEKPGSSVPRRYPVGNVVDELKDHMKIDNPKHGDKKIKRAFLMAAGKYAIEGDPIAFDQIAGLIPRGVWHNRLADFKAYVLSMPPEETRVEFEQVRRTLDKMVSTVGYQANSVYEKVMLPSRKLPSSELHRKLMRAFQFARDAGSSSLFLSILEEKDARRKKVASWIEKYTPYKITLEKGKYDFFKEPFKDFDFSGARRHVIYGRNEDPSNQMNG